MSQKSSSQQSAQFVSKALTPDTRWRQRMGEEMLVALVQESLSVATRTGAAKPSDFSKVIVDTTVQEKAVAFPTDAKPMHRARERLGAWPRSTACRDLALKQPGRGNRLRPWIPKQPSENG